MGLFAVTREAGPGWTNGKGSARAEFAEADRAGIRSCYALQSLEAWISGREERAPA